jgi:hypothetical protein
VRKNRDRIYTFPLAPSVAPMGALRPKSQYANELPGFKTMNTRQVFLLPRTWSLDREPKSRQASSAEITCSSTSPPSNSFFGFPFTAQVYRVHDRFAAAAPLSSTPRCLGSLMSTTQT